MDLSVKMATVLWVTRDIINKSQKGRPSIDEFYFKLLDQFSNNLKKKTAFSKKSLLFHQDNARVHRSVVAMTKFNELGSSHSPNFGIQSTVSIFCFKT